MSKLRPAALILVLAFLLPVSAGGASTTLKRLSKSITGVGNDQIVACTSELTGVIFVTKDGTNSTDCTDGNGTSANLCYCNGTAWTIASAGGGGTPGGADTQMQYNDGGAFGAEAGFTYVKGTDTLAVPNITVTTIAGTSGSISFSGSDYVRFATGAYPEFESGSVTHFESGSQLFFDTSATTTINNTPTIGAAGGLDAGSASGFEIPNAAAPVVNAAGEVAVDTTEDQFLYYGGALRTLDYRHDKSAAFSDPNNADAVIVWKAPYDLTLTGVDCTATGGTSIVMSIEECSSAGTSCVAAGGASPLLTAAITCSSGANTSGTISDGTVDSGDWVRVLFGAETGTVTTATISWKYTVDRK